MGGHVAANAVSERLIAEIAFDHPYQRLPLVIGDAVKGGGGLALVGDRLLDRMRRAPRVEDHGVLLLAIAIEPCTPFRIKMLRGLFLHPACKTLVEPEVVPPTHGYEIAKPLMRHL